MVGAEDRGSVMGGRSLGQSPITGSVVAPEAVRLDFQAADIGLRFVALIIALFVLAASLMLLIPDSVGIIPALLLVDFQATAAWRR